MEPRRRGARRPVNPRFVTLPDRLTVTKPASSPAAFWPGTGSRLKTLTGRPAAPQIRRSALLIPPESGADAATTNRLARRCGWVEPFATLFSTVTTAARIGGAG